ncbi:MAG: M23 family metallopeptidase [Cellulosilyticaceae bacterium]
MRGYVQREYTLLVIPGGIGETKNFKFRRWYLGIVGIILTSLIVVMGVLGGMLYQQLQITQTCQAVITQREAEIARLTQEKNSLEVKVAQVERQLAEQETQKSEAIEVVEAVGTAQVLAEPPKGEGGVDEEALSEYELTFKPCEGEMTSRFGNRTNPFTKEGKQVHKGVDVANSKGTPIYAAASGIVEVASYLKGYGYAIYINHGNGIQTRYGHNSELLVEAGEEVKKGQMIAKMGSTGNSTGPHLHFEILEEGKQVNPEKLFQ